MTGIVWGKNFFTACQKLDSIKNDYLASHIDVIKEIHSKDEYKLAFKNGDEWQALSATVNAYGYCANISYIDSTIDSEIRDTIIIPCTRKIPFCAYNFFNS